MTIEQEGKVFDRLTGGFRQTFSLSPEDFTPEELGQTTHKLLLVIPYSFCYT